MTYTSKPRRRISDVTREVIGPVPLQVWEVRLVTTERKNVSMIIAAMTIEEAIAGAKADHPGAEVFNVVHRGKVNKVMK